MLIFNFHHVEKQVNHVDRKHITISPQGLSRFIRTLRLLGMKTVSMRDVLATGGPADDSSRHVLLTFDDGYVNNLTEALPVLEAERCPATVFVLPGRFGGTNEWDQAHLPEAQRDPLMTLEQMKALTDSAWVTLGSHGMVHRKVSALSDDEIRYELQESYRILQSELGDRFLPVFAYPWGDYSEHAIALLEESPYRFAFTVENGQWRGGLDRFKIPRYSAFYRDGNPAVLLAKLCRHMLMPG